MTTSTPMTKSSIRAGFSIGVDVGGTKVAAGVVDAAGEIQTQSRKPMVANGAAAAGLASVTSAIDSLTAMNGNGNDKLLGIGICSPGPLDPASGVVINPPNLPCWKLCGVRAAVTRTSSTPALGPGLGRRLCWTEGFTTAIPALRVREAIT